MDPITDAEGNSLGYSYEDLANMTSAEREAFYASLFVGLTDEEISALEDSLQTQYYSYYGDETDGYYVQQAQLQAILDSDASSVTEKANAELLLTEMQGELDVYESFGTETSDAELYIAEHNIDATDGSTETIDAGSDVQNGEEYYVECGTTAVATSDPDWVSEDIETDTATTTDTNGDNVITEADGTTQTMYIATEDTDRVQASYDLENNSVRFAITKEDGTTYYITYHWPDGQMPNFNFTSAESLHNADLQGLDTTLLNHIYTGYDSDTSVGYYMGKAGDYFTTVDMSAQESNSYSEEYTEEDFNQGRNVDITCEDGTTDTLNLTFPDDAALTYFLSDDGSLVITATLPDGKSMTVTIHGWQTGYADATAPDQLNIEGGTMTDTEAANLTSFIMIGTFHVEGTGRTSPSGSGRDRPEPEND